MAKIVSLVGGQVAMEWALGEAEILIGRGGDCRIQLNHPSVSRHHAKLTQFQGHYFVEDLQSTNGVIVNGQRVHKRLLKHGDVLHIGSHELRCLLQPERQAPVDLDQTLVLQRPGLERPTPASALPAAPAQRDHRSESNRSEPGRAQVRFLNGPAQGQSRPVDKALYTLGVPGGHLAVISKRTQGYFLLHLGGTSVTTLNGVAVHGGGVRLNHRDIIQVGETRVEFLSEA